jgi:myo-inositol-1(or 4)-monophosphatase
VGDVRGGKEGSLPGAIDAGLGIDDGLRSARALESIAIEASSIGAALVRETHGQRGSIRTKSSPTDPVTALDLAVEEAVREHLARRTPGASFLGEEEGASGGHSQVGWILDPIDGTVNLTYDVPLIAVSLAATLHGDVVAGAVVDVWRDEVYSASTGGGASRGGTSISPSSVPELGQALVATGFDYSSDGRAAQAETFARVLPAARDIRCFGSSALHLCWVACGRVDAYYQRDSKRWDYAAGALIAEEAGARVTRPTPANGELLVAASPLVFEPLLSLLT